MERELRLEPMKNWEANEPDKLTKVIKILENIAEKTGASIADTIIIAGNVGLEKALKKGGSKIKVPFIPGRGDSSQKQTEIKSFKWLEPLHDGFRNYVKSDYSVMPEELYIRACIINGVNCKRNDLFSRRHESARNQSCIC